MYSVGIYPEILIAGEYIIGPLLTGDPFQDFQQMPETMERTDIHIYGKAFNLQIRQRKEGRKGSYCTMTFSLKGSTLAHPHCQYHFSLHTVVST
jgi:hypothetical protein